MIKDIVSTLQSFTNAQRKTMALRNYPTRLEIIGVTVPDLKTVLKSLRTNTREWNHQEKIELAQALVETNFHECHHLAYMYLEQEKATLKALTAKQCEQLAQSLDNWVLVDTYCTYILGVLWRWGVVSDAYMHQLAESDDLWKKRCAIVSTVALNQKARGGKGDAMRTLDICQKAIDDKRPLIAKAVSWALRVLVAIDRNAVEEFLTANENSLSRLVIREVNNKLNTGLKNPN